MNYIRFNEETLETIRKKVTNLAENGIVQVLFFEKKKREGEKSRVIRAKSSNVSDRIRLLLLFDWKENCGARSSHLVIGLLKFSGRAEGASEPNKEQSLTLYWKFQTYRRPSSADPLLLLLCNIQRKCRPMFSRPFMPINENNIESKGDLCSLLTFSLISREEKVYRFRAIDSKKLIKFNCTSGNRVLKRCLDDDPNSSKSFQRNVVLWWI